MDKGAVRDLRRFLENAGVMPCLNTKGISGMLCLILRLMHFTER